MKTFDTGMASSWRALRRIALVAIVGIAAGAAAFAQPHHSHGDGGPGMMMWGRHLDRALEAVGASDAQRTQIKQITDAARTDLETQHQAARDLRQQMMQAFTQPTVDANAVEALRQQMLAQHDQASRRMMQAMLDVSRVLTPEQRAKLAERMQQRRAMMERHMQERGQPDAKQ
jgi:Spy/CpxP family protein refolding chaperone